MNRIWKSKTGRKTLAGIAAAVMAALRTTDLTCSDSMGDDQPATG